MKHSKLNRREFIVGGTKVAVGASLLPTLFSFEAEASGEAPKRFIAIHSRNGQRQEYWTPRVAASVPFAGGREVDLRTFGAAGISPILTPAFAPFLSKIALVQGLDIVSPMGHNSQSMLGHFSTGQPFPTIDRVLAKSPKFTKGRIPVIDSLSYGESFSYGYSGSQFTRFPAFMDIGGSFERVFGLGDSSTLSRHSGIMSKTFDLYKKLESDSRLPASDKRLVETQAALVGDLQKRLSQMQPLSCGTMPGKLSGSASNEAGFIAAVDMIVASMFCGATQLACIGISNPDPVSTPNGWHGSSHNSEAALGSALNSLTVNKWIAEKFVLRLITELDKIPEGSGTMLDNTLIYWGNEISGGNGHTVENMPVFLAGSAGGKIRTGYLYDYRQHDAPEVAIDNAGSKSKIGRPYNQLMVTILQAMGLSPSDYETGGFKGYGVNQSKSAARNSRYTSMMPEIGNPLNRLFIG